MASDPPDRYRRLVELSPDGIFISQDNRIVFLNPAAVRLFGASAPAQILGKSPFELFHVESHALMRERIGLMMAGQTVPPAEEKIVRLDGVVTDLNSVKGTFADRLETAKDINDQGEITGRAISATSVRTTYLAVPIN